MGRKIAPNALLGFPPAFWEPTPTVIGTEMQAVGANLADFIVAQTSDRDAGCIEPGVILPAELHRTISIKDSQDAQ
jgi:hypothetical protein